MGEGGGGRGVDGLMDEWMNRDGLALGRSLVRYLGGLLIGGLVLDSNRREEEGEEEEEGGETREEETGFRNGLV